MEDRIRSILERYGDEAPTLIAELVIEYQARAWDRGFTQCNDVGRCGPSKAKRNPYRKNELDG